MKLDDAQGLMTMLMLVSTPEDWPELKRNMVVNKLRDFPDLPGTEAVGRLLCTHPLGEPFSFTLLKDELTSTIKRSCQDEPPSVDKAWEMLICQNATRDVFIELMAADAKGERDTKAHAHLTATLRAVREAYEFGVESGAPIDFIMAYQKQFHPSDD